MCVRRAAIFERRGVWEDSRRKEAGNMACQESSWEYSSNGRNVSERIRHPEIKKIKKTHGRRRGVGGV